tara:strand:- start:17435 stop:17800 length:366 start_codon:yes stop_codon:yes gene_type:complete
MRLLLPSLLAATTLALPTQDAEACSESGCVTIVASALQPAEPEQAAPEPSVAPAADESEVRAHNLAKLEPQTPEFWLQFKSYAYKQLPTHEDKSFKAVWIGMAVQTPDETVAGFGLQGIWW